MKATEIPDGSRIYSRTSGRFGYRRGYNICFDSGSRWPVIYSRDDYIIVENENMLTVTKERVLEAAKQCPTAKETLKALFPEAFEDEKYFQLGRQGTRLDNSEDLIKLRLHPATLSIRNAGQFAGKAFFLDNKTDSTVKWEIVKDEFDVLCLLPTKTK